jgi:hypothetical protein
MADAIHIPDEYRFRDEDFDSDHRRDGLSGFLRLRDEADHLDRVLDGFLPHLDDVVLVYNRCRDRTPEIVRNYAHRHPEKIRAFDYRPPVHPPGSRMHSLTSPASVHSLVYYNNFALSRTRCRFCVKIDGDLLPIEHRFKSLADEVRRDQPASFVAFSGINLWKWRGRLYVVRNHPFCGHLGDIGFFPAGRHRRFHHQTKFEELGHGLPVIHRGIAYFHLKGVKPDRGISKYDLGENPGSTYRRLLFAAWGLTPPLLSWPAFRRRYRIPDDIPDPNTLGL